MNMELSLALFGKDMDLCFSIREHLKTVMMRVVFKMESIVKKNSFLKVSKLWTSAMNSGIRLYLKEPIQLKFRNIGL